MYERRSPVQPFAVNRGAETVLSKTRSRQCGRHDMPAGRGPAPAIQYLVAYFDTNGVGRLSGAAFDLPDAASAQARIEEIEAAQFKVHKVDYRVIADPAGQRLAAMHQHGIVAQ
jgi:hypothetical protein